MSLGKSAIAAAATNGSLLIQDSTASDIWFNFADAHTAGSYSKLLESIKADPSSSSIVDPTSINATVVTFSNQNGSISVLDNDNNIIASFDDNNNSNNPGDNSGENGDDNTGTEDNESPIDSVQTAVGSVVGTIRVAEFEGATMFDILDEEGESTDSLSNIVFTGGFSQDISVVVGQTVILLDSKNSVIAQATITQSNIKATAATVVLAADQTVIPGANIAITAISAANLTDHTIYASRATSAEEFDIDDAVEFDTYQAGSTALTVSPAISAGEDYHLFLVHKSGAVSAASANTFDVIASSITISAGTAIDTVALSGVAAGMEYRVNNSVETPTVAEGTATFAAGIVAIGDQITVRAVDTKVIGVFVVTQDNIRIAPAADFSIQTVVPGATLTLRSPITANHTVYASQATTIAEFNADLARINASPAQAPTRNTVEVTDTGTSVAIPSDLAKGNNFFLYLVSDDSDAVSKSLNNFNVAESTYSVAAGTVVGSIKLSGVTAGMEYQVEGGTRTAITAANIATDITAGVAVGKVVSIYAGTAVANPNPIAGITITQDNIKRPAAITIPGIPGAFENTSANLTGLIGITENSGGEGSVYKVYVSKADTAAKFAADFTNVAAGTLATVADQAHGTVALTTYNIDGTATIPILTTIAAKLTVGDRLYLYQVHTSGAISDVSTGNITLLDAALAGVTVAVGTDFGTTKLTGTVATGMEYSTNNGTTWVPCTVVAGEVDNIPTLTAEGILVRMTGTNTRGFVTIFDSATDVKRPSVATADSGILSLTLTDLDASAQGPNPASRVYIGEANSLNLTQILALTPVDAPLIATSTISGLDAGPNYIYTVHTASGAFSVSASVAITAE